MKLCIILKCISGPHLGQKFRLEATTVSFITIFTQFCNYSIQQNGEDVFKIGRSTGKLFKEKGVSLYKDKEISTTHAKVFKLTVCLSLSDVDALQIEFRNGQVFLVDVESTNGTQLNRYKELCMKILTLTYKLI